MSKVAAAAAIPIRRKEPPRRNKRVVRLYRRLWKIHQERTMK